MSMSWSYYVGPYLTIPRDAPFDFEKWESILTDGRGEAGVGEKVRFLVPNYHLDRVTQFNKWGEEDEVISVTPAMLVREKAQFSSRAADFIKECEASNIDVREGWGVVPHFG